MTNTVTVTPTITQPIRLPDVGVRIMIPSSTIFPTKPNPTPARGALAVSSPVTQNGSFEFDRVLKSGYVQRRTRKTKKWKTVFLVLRPNALSFYKSENEGKLRHKVYLSELSAVTLLRDPKQKRHNLFGLFSPSKNFHFEAPTAKDAQEWIDLIRQDARIEEEEEAMFLASPIVRRQSFGPVSMLAQGSASVQKAQQPCDQQRCMSSSPEPTVPAISKRMNAEASRTSQYADSLGFSGNEMASHSDFSDNDGPRHVMARSREQLPVARQPSTSQVDEAAADRPELDRQGSQQSGLNTEQDPDRVVWQGRLLFLKSKGGVKQWKSCWAVLRPRNLILYKDETEYTATFIVDLPAVVNAVYIDPVSKTKTHCMQIITDEKSYRFCATDEESLLRCLGAFKSLIAKRKELAMRQKVKPSAAPANQ